MKRKVFLLLALVVTIGLFFAVFKDSRNIWVKLDLTFAFIVACWAVADLQVSEEKPTCYMCGHTPGTNLQCRSCALLRVKLMHEGKEINNGRRTEKAGDREQ